MTIQFTARTDRRYRPVFRQWIQSGLRISETIDNLRPVGAKVGIIVLVRDAASRRSALRAARQALPRGKEMLAHGLEHVSTVDEHLARVRKNLSYIDGHVRPGYITLDMEGLKRQIEKDLEGVDAAIYIYRAPPAAAP